VLPLNSKDEEGVWTWGKSKVENNIDLLAGRLVGTGAWRVFRKDYLPKDGATTKAKSIWLESSINHEHGKEEVGRLFGYTPFDFPKSVDLLKRCLQLGTAGDEEEIVLDFFAGSATTGQAVLELNKEDGGQRRYILVQLPEPLSSDTEAHAKGLRSLADIGIERMRLVNKKLANSDGGLKLSNNEDDDTGFRVFKLAESNYKQWTGVEDNNPEKFADQMEAFADPLKDKWEPESVIYEVAIKEGFGLGLIYEPVASIKSNKVFRVSDPDKEQSFLICLDDTLDEKTPSALELQKDDLFVCRDIALTDELAANLALQCRLKTV
jgi:adenine-specific DNA-methyltransferase